MLKEILNNQMIVISLIGIGLLICCLILNKSCDILGDNLEEISNDIKMDRNIAGATFLAISSSLPEFLTSFISIVILGKFEDVGFSTVAGSGIFNALLIPMLAILAFKGDLTKIKLNKTVLKRDFVFYISTIFTLAVSMFLGEFSWKTGLVLTIIYLVYLNQLKRTQTTEIEWSKAKKQNIIKALISLIPIALIVHISIELALALADITSMPVAFVSIIILAIVTSLPDAMLSVAESRKGEIDSAISNAIGSNIFDLCICLGLNLLITGAVVKVNFSDSYGTLMFLLISVITTLFVISDKIKKRNTLLMLAVYLMFIIYVFNF